MSGRPCEYEVIIRGRLGPTIEAALDGFHVTTSNSDETHLRGWLADQAALHGVLERIRDLGLELTAVNRVG